MGTRGDNVTVAAVRAYLETDRGRTTPPRIARKLLGADLRCFGVNPKGKATLEQVHQVRLMAEDLEREAFTVKDCRPRVFISMTA